MSRTRCVAEQGFALVAVLVTLAVAALLVGAALTLADTAVGSAQGYAAEVEGGSAADAAIRLAAVRLVHSEGYTLADLSPGKLTWMGWNVVVRIEDEATKRDLNRAPRRDLAAALGQAGVALNDVTMTGATVRYVSVDSFAGRRASAETLARLRRRFTVYGGAEPQPEGPRSALETYRIVASASRDSRSVTRWAIVRVSPGFGEPFEWLERGAQHNVTNPPSRNYEPKY